MTAFAPAPDHGRIRARFPALNRDLVFFENAGGSQVPDCVADRMYRYLTETYVQLEAGYPLSQACTETVADAHAFARRFVNAGEEGEVLIGASSTALLNMIAAGYGGILGQGDRIVLAESGHEANLGPWKRLEKLGVEIVWWRVDPASGELALDDLRDLVKPGASLVALPQVSNLLGGIIDLAEVSAVAHGAGARVVADGVAYAPHRVVDVQAWDVDWYVYSTYKVYGPHMAVLYGKREAFAELPGPNHFFIPEDALPYSFEPGGASHEGCAGLLGLGDYLSFVAGAPEGGPCDRDTIERAFATMEAWESPLIDRMLGDLERRENVRVIGPPAGPDRVGTISFVHASRSSREIASAINESGIALRHGHMYAWHLCEAMGLEPADGVVRISFVHYNSIEEIERLSAVLDRVL